MSMKLKAYAVLCAIALALASTLHGCPAEAPKSSGSETHTTQTETTQTQTSSDSETLYVVYGAGGRWENVTNPRESFVEGAAAGGSTEIPRLDFTQSDGKSGWVVGPYAVLEY